MRNKMAQLLLMLFFIQVGMGQDLKAFHDDLDIFLFKNVKDGKVDYQSIKENPTHLYKLINTSKDLEVSLKDVNHYQSFWINAYNLYVIKSIIDSYPISSPLDVPGFFDKRKHHIAGQQVTLNEIENNLLRARFKDPRFHFVLVCGAMGCPPLIPNAYKPKELNFQLERQTRLAINDDQFIRSGKKVAISQIFEWYKEDFEQEGAVIDFINKYRKVPFNSRVKIKYYSYNWKINKQK